MSRSYPMRTPLLGPRSERAPLRLLGPALSSAQMSGYTITSRLGDPFFAESENKQSFCFQ